MKFLLTICRIIVILGAINLGFMGFLNINLIALSFAKIPFSTNIIYMIIGLCGV
jgi:uncharacterized membrane protein YuzA (DUF378 family)